MNIPRIFLGFESDPADLWVVADVFAMRSRGGGIRTGIRRGDAQGIPVVTAVNDSGDEINQDGVTGFNIDLDCPGVPAAQG